MPRMTLEDIYLKARNLCNEVNDPHTEPYRSKYAARELFLQLKSQLDKQLESDELHGGLQLHVTRARLSVVFYQLGVISAETEELSTAQEQFSRCLGVLGVGSSGDDEISSSSPEDDDSTLGSETATVTDSKASESSSESEMSVEICPGMATPLTVAVTVSCHNQLGLLWSRSDQHRRAWLHLDAARQIYTLFRQQNMQTGRGESLPSTLDGLFAPDEGGATNPEGEEADEGAGSLEKLHTMTLYYLAQVYAHLGQPEASADYCRATLKRQLDSKDYNPLEWAFNAATLAQFYQGKENFRAARRLLAAASAVLAKNEPELSHRETEDSNREDSYRQRCADVDRSWGRYCIQLLELSWSHLEEGEGVGASASVVKDDDLIEFMQLELEGVESEIECQCVHTFETARTLFLFGLRHLTSASRFFCMEEHATEAVGLAQDMGVLYKHLAFFETDQERRSKMLKRRVDLLTAALQELNPQYYLHLCQQLNYELGESYTAILDCKLTSTGDLTSHAKKVNNLCTSAIRHFTQYLQSFNDPHTGRPPKKYPESLVRPSLIAWFHLGRLWSKIVATNAQNQLSNLGQSLDCYKKFVQYCHQNPKSQECVSEEFNICEEMVQLLPLKIHRMRNQ